MRVVADENMPAVEQLLGDRAQVRRLPGRQITRADVAGADALLVRSVTPVNAALLAGTGIRFVGTATAGTDHVDVSWLREAGITFADAAGANANSVVEYVLCAVAETDDFLERLLAGAVLGIVGFGHVGSLLASRLEGLGIRFRAHDPWLAPGAVANACSLAEALACDVICLHPALTDAAPWPSRHLLAGERLAALHASQLLINASRGEVVDNHALLARLQAPAAPQTVLDVWEHEPRIMAPLLEHVRLGTAHIAGYSHDSKLLATQRLVQAMECCGLLSGASVSGLADEPRQWRLDSAASTADAIRQLLASAYTVSADDQQLRAVTLNVAPAQAAGQFDELRKHYPLRRELAGSHVVLTTATAAYSEVVTALGCHCETEVR